MSVVRLQVLGDCIIEVNGTRVDPGSTHLFALLLILALENERRVSRSELQRMLFAAGVGARQASHNLRQLLYRVRRLGVPLDETPTGLRICAGELASYEEQLRELTKGSCEGLDSIAVRFLPSYYPRLPQPYLEWVERERQVVDGMARSRLLSALTTLCQDHLWTAAGRVGRVLLEIDPLCEDAARATAEALSMTGRREDARRLLDRFNQNFPGSKETADKWGLQGLRTRVATSPHTSRVGSLRGRAECIGLLSAEWAKAASGGARLTTLIGPPGIGKTRVAHDFAASVALAGAKVIQHKCDDSSAQFPLSLFAGILPELWQMRGSLGIAPHHRNVLSRLSPSSSVGHPIASGVALELLRGDLDLALVDLVESISSERSLLLVLDDAHLLDDTSLALLKSFATSANSATLLVIACARPRDRVSALMSARGRSTSYALPGLSASDACQLLRELDAGGQHSPEHLAWCVRQAEGNPFYLHSLSRLSSSDALVPFDISSLASSSYHCLGPGARFVLECCLYLNSLATLPRLGTITGFDDIALLAFLRELEESDLVRLQGCVVRGPHALLDEALRALIPSTVAALVHKRIAMTLTSECARDAYSIPLALAASRSWLAYGDVEQGVSLLRRCAADIAAIGDPGAAADLLAQVAHDLAPIEARRALLDDVIMYGEAGGSRALVTRALTERLHIGQRLDESALAVARMRFRLIESELSCGSWAHEVVSELSSLLMSDDADEELRARCLATLLIIADAQLDADLAHRLAGELGRLSETSRRNLHAVRALLIYHTTFGERAIAAELATELARRFPQPLMDEECRIARRFASYALYRLMRHPQSRTLLEADYAFMSSRGVRSEALSAASLLTEIAIAVGNFAEARGWFRKVELQLRGGAAHKLAPNSGYYSSAALFAMMDGNYERAHQLLDIPWAEDARMHTPRYESVLIALRLRAHMMNGMLHTQRALTDRLRELHERGRALGAQDTIVEMLWCAKVMDGDTAGASELLHSYLTEFRREDHPIEWSLRMTTAADEIWPLLDNQRQESLGEWELSSGPGSPLTAERG
jgi:Predicted ATPase